MHGLIFETSVCYWQNQPGCYLSELKRDALLRMQLKKTIDLGHRERTASADWVIFPTHPWQPRQSNQKEVSYFDPDLKFPIAFRCLIGTLVTLLSKMVLSPCFRFGGLGWQKVLPIAEPNNEPWT